MITRRAKYALKALLHLAARPGGEPIGAGEIASAEGIPLPFLEQILLVLRRSGFVESRKGRRGGHRLARDPRTISLLEILRVVDGPVAPLPCLSRTSYERCADCADEAACGVRSLCAGVYEVQIEKARSTMLADGIPSVRRRERPMSTVVHDGRTFELDARGFLADYESWSEEFAAALAPEIGIEGGLTEAHWGVVRFIREFYANVGQIPVVYQTCRANGLRMRQLGELFPAGYLRGACRLAGISWQSGYRPYSSVIRYREMPGDGPVEERRESRTYAIDGYGFLVDPAAWDRDFAMLRAHETKVPGGLTEEHWRVIDYLRDGHSKTGVVPNVARTCRDLGLEVDDLERLFPDGFNRGAIKLAGLRPATA